MRILAIGEVGDKTGGGGDRPRGHCIWLFFHRPVGLVELLILYARVQFYTPQASDYRLISKTAKMATKLKIEKRGDEILIVHCCFSISQNDLKF
jgi:hypothetical protein